MQVSLVMTVIGPDRPGLVGQLSAVITEHGGNWLESRMAHLGGEFAGILRIEVPAEQEQNLQDKLRSLKSQGLTVYPHKDITASAPPSGSLAIVELIGHDRPGIVRQISQVLAQHRVNVEELVTNRESAPMSGEMLFRATATVRLPASCPLGQLQSALEEIASDLMADITIRPNDAP
jgi:glycine cleavage system regulatory protein